MEQLHALLSTLGVERQAEDFVDVFRELLGTWGAERIGQRPTCPSYIADDEAPYEFCVAFSAMSPPEVQVYVEPQGSPPSLRTNMAAGRALLERVALRLDASLERLRQVEGLLFPVTPQAPFTIWIGLSWTAGQDLRLKVYLNPQVRGAALAFDVVAEALKCFGFAEAWSHARRALLPDGERRDEPTIISLDLSRVAEPRVKVYFRHHGASLADLDALASITTDFHAGDGERFYSALALTDGPYLLKPALTELAFVAPAEARPRSITFEFPLGSYVENDEVACERIKLCMESFEVPSHGYERAVRAFARRPLRDDRGMHAHVTLRRAHGRPRIAVYFASEAYKRRSNAAVLREPHGAH